MSASCPQCGLKLGKFDKRPAANETVQCPECKSNLTFRTKFGVIKPFMLATIAVSLIVSRFDEVNEVLAASAALIVGVGLGVAAVLSERLEIARENSDGNGKAS